jgi:hypothetical protein
MKLALALFLAFVTGQAIHQLGKEFNIPAISRHLIAGLVGGAIGYGIGLLNI